jgi:2-methylcitrate dehydratase PrpD
MGGGYSATLLCGYKKMTNQKRLTDFIHDLTWDNIPQETRDYARLCLLDTVGTAVAATQTPASRSVYDFAAVAFGGSGACLWLDGRSVSPPGAALAHATTIDSLDIHDGYKPSKGHAGVAVIPAAVATLSLDPQQPIAGKAFLTSIVIGYEVALRAAVSLHATACDYHTSGAWNALGAAAITARRLHLNHEQTRHALGIAEYYGPRSPMMRGADYPTMVKDGSGWGAMTGVSAGLLAASGFTGAPAVTIESEQVAEFWADLGGRWLITEQYFKPFAVCYWAQPAVNGALQLQAQHNLQSEAIERIHVTTFHEATHLTTRRPQTTEEAQYSLPFPVAAALVHGRLGPAELMGNALEDARVLSLTERIEIREGLALSARFPAERLAQVQMVANGREYDSGIVTPRWGDSPPTEEELRQKFRLLASYVLPEERAQALETLIWNIGEVEDASSLPSLLASAA